MVDARVPLYKAADTSNGDSQLILTADAIFSNLEKNIDNGYGTKYKEWFFDQGIELILTHQSNPKGPLDEKTIQLDASKEKFDLETYNMKNYEWAKNKIAHCDMVWLGYPVPDWLEEFRIIG